MALAPDIEGFSRLITALDPWLDRVVIVGGWADFPITKGSLPTPFRPGNSICQSSNCLANAFVTKIDPQTSQILYSTFIGGSGREAIRGLAVDSAGNAYVAGTTTSPDFPVTPGAAQTKFNLGHSSTHWDGFVAKLNATGSALVYATYLGGSTDDEILDLALDSTGAVVVTGDGSYDFPVTAGALQAAILSGSTYGQLFVAKTGPERKDTRVFGAPVAVRDRSERGFGFRWARRGRWVHRLGRYVA